ncbi:MAG: hypothetical protein Unbinned8472contig1000_66 [Prokaryotic dsDNA virus sp.]|nr:MAG: hypothetical protein Unbinned8472contig1000_66 [Prokaryotic dsDNA virus sp.]|tara:strand:+ start:45407 stop:46129 length:723 start_codon:yes stop_codon:yes gene_type:complete
MNKNHDTLMIHSVSSNLGNNAAKFCHNSLQGHHHSLFGIQYYADRGKLRWSMGVGCLADPNSPAMRYGSGATLKRPILGCGVLEGQESFLVISDMHIPYHHKDSFKFLQAVYEFYSCRTVLNVGDLVDHHAGSYHESEPDAMNPEEEYAASQEYLRELEEMFPVMHISNGNHCNIPKRKLKTLGLPPSMVSDYNRLYGLSGGWNWCDEYWFDSKGATPTLVPMELNSKGRWNGKICGVKV